MTKSSPQKWLTIILMVLIVVNIAALVHFFFFPQVCRTGEREEHHRKHKPGDFIRQELGLSDSQNEQMEAMRKSHSDTLSLTVEKMRDKRNFLSMEMMKDQPDTTLLYQTCDEIGELYGEIRKLNVNHYWQMKQICNPEQKKKLDTIFKGVFSCDEAMFGKFKKHKKQGCAVQHSAHPCINN